MLDTKKLLKKTCLIFFLVSLFCIGFNYVYSLFGHGVSSDSMKYAFLYPLVLGTGMYLLMYILDRYDRVSYNLYNAGIATLTLGSIYQGVIDIAGADTTYSIYYFILGIVLVLVSLGILAYKKTTKREF